MTSRSSLEWVRVDHSGFTPDRCNSITYANAAYMPAPNVGPESGRVRRRYSAGLYSASWSPTPRPTAGGCPSCGPRPLTPQTTPLKLRFVPPVARYSSTFRATYLPPRQTAAPAGGVNRYPASCREALAGVVPLARAVQAQRQHAEEMLRTLPAPKLREKSLARVVRQSLPPRTARDLDPSMGADRALDVADRSSGRTVSLRSRAPPRTARSNVLSPPWSRPWSCSTAWCPTTSAGRCPHCRIGDRVAVETALAFRVSPRRVYFDSSDVPRSLHSTAAEAQRSEVSRTSSAMTREVDD